MSSQFYKLYVNDTIFMSAYLLLSLLVEEESSLSPFFHSDAVTVHTYLQGNRVQVHLYCMTFSVFLLLFMSFHFISFGHPTGADPQSHFTLTASRRKPGDLLTIFCTICAFTTLGAPYSVLWSWLSAANFVEVRSKINTFSAPRTGEIKGWLLEDECESKDENKCLLGKLAKIDTE